jgi:hypothetical protein
MGRAAPLLFLSRSTRSSTTPSNRWPSVWSFSWFCRFSMRFVLKEPMSALGFRGSRSEAWMDFHPACDDSGPFCPLPFRSSIIRSKKGIIFRRSRGTRSWLFLAYQILHRRRIIFSTKCSSVGSCSFCGSGPYGFFGDLFSVNIFPVFVLFTDGVTWQSAPMMFSAVAAGFVAYYTSRSGIPGPLHGFFCFLSDTYLLTLITKNI